ncbi:MAG: DUF975 family protein [Lachnospiraceae bacterium]|nr:DUF975 family protein [Lachnospiraceae bacterium]
MSENNYSPRKNREIRGYARERLLGNMFIPCLVTLFFFFMHNTFEIMMQLGVLGKDTFSFVFYIVLFLTVNSLWGIIRYGISRYFLSFITTKKAHPMDVFAGLRHSTEVIISASLFMTVISLVFQLPYLIYSFFFASNTVAGLIVGLIMLTAGNIILFFIECYLSQIYFVICDYPGMRFPMVLLMSLSLMGMKYFLKYIRLKISFIPLYALGFMSLGVGLLWVVPYAYTSYAYFYEDLCERYLQECRKRYPSSVN